MHGNGTKKDIQYNKRIDEGRIIIIISSPPFSQADLDTEATNNAGQKTAS